jgi:hypothetical protein
MDPQQLIDQLVRAEQQVHATRALLKAAPHGTAEHQSAIVAFFEATIAQMSLVAIVQTQEVMGLTLDIARLRGEVAALGQQVGFAAPSATLH